MRIRVFCLFSAGFGLISAPVYGQQGVNLAGEPTIVVTGHGETKISPDRATISIAVESRAPTAAAAANDNARKQAAVIFAIKSLGVADDQISTTSYSVSPEQRYEPNKPPTITGYVVTNTVVAEVRAITSVGPVIDAALSHGANMISGLSFYSSNTEAARRTSIAAAVIAARADADAAAKAARGTLGALLEINIGAYSFPPPRPIMVREMAMATTAQADTPISPGQQTVSVEVTTRWRFVPVP